MINKQWQGYLRKDGRKGIRNYIVVVSLVECSNYIARELTSKYTNQAIQLISFAGKYSSDYTEKTLMALCTHPNVGGVLIFSMEYDNFNCKKLEEIIDQSGRPVRTIFVEKVGGTRLAIKFGVYWIDWCLSILDNTMMIPMTVSDLVVGTICATSDGLSPVTANPAVGYACNTLVAQNGTALFGGVGVIAGLQEVMLSRAKTGHVAQQLKGVAEKTAKYFLSIPNAGLLPGEVEGGLTTIEEKSTAAYCKSGDAAISGVLKAGERPSEAGLYVVDMLPDDPIFQIPHFTLSAEIAGMIASGCHVVLFSTGKGSVIGSAISPLIKICANPKTYLTFYEETDVNAAGMLNKGFKLEEVGEKILEKIVAVASRKPSCSEWLGHRELMIIH